MALYSTCNPLILGLFGKPPVGTYFAQCRSISEVFKMKTLMTLTYIAMATFVLLSSSNSFAYAKRESSSIQMQDPKLRIRTEPPCPYKDRINNAAKLEKTVPSTAFSFKNVEFAPAVGEQ